MEVVTGDRYLESLVKFVERNVGQLIEGSMVLKLNPVGLHYVYSRVEALNELERLISGAPVDYLRAYISDLGDHRAIEQLRRILCRLTSLTVVSVLPPPARDPTPLYLLPFGRLKVLELRGCNLSTSAAKGLLELCHTLEKLICHNSTDALRHIFASRISDIKDSPHWNRLSFVSCACNRLVLMDESLQLLPAVEILDLSRNKFAKVDNLRKCEKLAHLDLGFNQLKSVAHFREITCNIVKLVLRNNSLTTLQGIEDLKSLEGLDLSHNVISNFSELEILSALPSLRNLWLEGNPFCCAGWYRPQVFSYFRYPQKLKLDDKEISNREFWKRQIVIARRQTRPASYGFYSPAREDTEEEGLLSRKAKKASRLASIQSQERKRYSDQDSMSSGNEIYSGEEKTASVDEPAVAGLIDIFEDMKKESSIHQLWDSENRMERPSENFLNGSKYGNQIPNHHAGNPMKTKPGLKHVGESLVYESDPVHALDYGVSNSLESESSFAGAGDHHDHHHISAPAKETPSNNHGHSEHRADAHRMQGRQSYVNMKRYQLATKYSSRTDLAATQVGNNLNKVVNVRPVNVVNDLVEISKSANYPKSPPHFQEDILHRLHDLEEEILQLSADSFSVVSSDSDTSSNEDETFGHSPQCHNKLRGQQVLQGQDTDGDSSCHSVEMNEGQTIQHSKAEKVCGCSLDLHSEQVCDQVLLGPECSLEMQMKHIREVKKRVVPLLDEDHVSKDRVACDTESFHLEGMNTGLSRQGHGDEIKEHRSDMINNEGVKMSRNTFPLDDQAGAVHAHGKELENCVEHYFNSVIADSGVHEMCKEFILCTCIVEQEMEHEEREVFVVLSSEGKLYSILVNAIFHWSGKDAGLISSYKVEDISEILVGLGLQVLRVYVSRYEAFMYITKSAEKSRCFLGMLEALNSDEASHRSCLRSLECAQIDWFHKKICGRSKVGIHQYSMVLFTCNDSEDGQWISRSLFVCQRHLFVCIEDVQHFSSLSTDAASADYFSLDSVCCIADVSELVIEGKGSYSVTLQLEPHQSQSCLSGLTDLIKFDTGVGRGKKPIQSKTWRFKWLSEATFYNFVSLLKAIHEEMATSALSIKCVS